MATTYVVDFMVTLSTTRNIVANTEEQLTEIIGALLDNDLFYEGLIESWEGPFSGWNECSTEVLDSGDELLPELDDEDWKEIYGIDMKVLRKED